MAKEYGSCGNCGAQIFEARMGKSNLRVGSTNLTQVNLFSQKPLKDACQTCAVEIAKGAIAERENLRSEIASRLECVPISTIHSPVGWDYKFKGIVSAQCVLGTGLFSEVVSDFTDIFGMNSQVHAEKLKKGEDTCFARIRMAALERGGNAIVATDVDYSEVGGAKAMLMVCVTGSAVDVGNANEVGIDTAALNDLAKLRERLARLETSNPDWWIRNQ